MKTSSAKAKGRRLAQEIKTMMMTVEPTLEDDDIRVTPSGVTGEDLSLSPTARHTFPIAPECKNQESLNIWKSLEQAEANANNYVPVLFFKRNRSKVYAAVEADVLLNLLKGNRYEFQSESEAATQSIQNAESLSQTVGKNDGEH